MSRTALAVSPHLDDAAFSCGGTLAALARGGWRVILATVFTASVDRPQGFALACQLDKGLAADVDYMALRRAEDEEAARALGIAMPVWLPFPEAPHRGYASAADLFAGVHDDDAVELDAALGGLIAATKPDLLLGPQGVGGHVDHVQVVEALQRVAVDRPLLWWTDFPYSLRADTPRRPFAEAMAMLDAIELSLTAQDRARKREACRCYGSQLGFQFGGRSALDGWLADAGDREIFRGVGAVEDLMPAGARRVA